MTEKQTIRKDLHESSRDFATRLLSSMFQEVFAHTGREMSEEHFDRCSDIVDEIVEAVSERERQIARSTW